jgi:hypothetical protein
MSFELSHTPTLEAVATDDEQILAQDMQTRVAEATAHAFSLPEVAAALEASAAANLQLDRLRSAERTLQHWAKDTRDQLESAGRAALDHLIETAALGAKLDRKKAAEAAELENQIRFAGRAIERVTEHLLPLALIAQMREAAHALHAQSRALESVAQERAERVLGQIRAAVSDEMVLPVDLSKGVAGALLVRAKDLKARATSLSAEAEELELNYQERMV